MGSGQETAPNHRSNSHHHQQMQISPAFARGFLICRHLRPFQGPFLFCYDTAATNERSMPFKNIKSWIASIPGEYKEKTKSVFAYVGAILSAALAGLTIIATATGQLEDIGATISRLLYGSPSELKISDVDAWELKDNIKGNFVVAFTVSKKRGEELAGCILRLNRSQLVVPLGTVESISSIEETASGTRIAVKRTQRVLDFPPQIESERLKLQMGSASGCVLGGLICKGERRPDGQWLLRDRVYLSCAGRVDSNLEPIEILPS